MIFKYFPKSLNQIDWLRLESQCALNDAVEYLWEWFNQIERLKLTSVLSKLINRHVQQVNKSFELTFIFNNV